MQHQTPRAMHAFYRLRDALALTRAELTTLCAASALLGLGLFAQHLPEPPTVLSPQTIAYAAHFQEAAEAPASVTDAALGLPVPAPAVAGEPAPRRAKKTGATPAQPVGLNTATAAQLETLPRIGPAMARRILDYRAQRGAFTRVEDLRNVKGIGAKTLENLRPLVTLD